MEPTSPVLNDALVVTDRASKMSKFLYFRQQIRIQQLTDEKNSLQERLKTADDTVERQIKQIENLTLQLGEAERTLAEKEEDMESLNKTSKDEVHCLFVDNFFFAWGRHRSFVVVRVGLLICL